MIRAALAALALILAASPARAEILFYAYDPADTLTQSLTRGITLEMERGFLGGISIRRLFSTGGRGSAALERGGPSGVIDVLPEDARERTVYRIVPEGDGRALANALCPASEEAWLVSNRIRGAGALTLHAVGRWADGGFRHCAPLRYDFRGEWAGTDAPPDAGDQSSAPRPQ